MKVEAFNWQQAEQMVADGWQNGKYVLGKDHFEGIAFRALSLE